MKYRLVAKPASANVMPRRSIKIFGAVVFVPTSIPTWHMIPIKQSRIKGLPSKARHSPKVEGRPSSLVSWIVVAPNSRIAITAITI